MNIKVLTKITYIVFVSLLFYSTSYGKISKEYYNAIFEGCMDGALKVNNNYQARVSNIWLYEDGGFKLYYKNFSNLKKDLKPTDIIPYPMTKP